MFGTIPKQYTSPLEGGYHPEINTTDEIDKSGIKKYQSLIGSLQLSITLGILDITTAVMTMSRFIVVPQKVHLDRSKRICVYLSKMNFSTIRIQVDQPDFSDVPINNFD